MRRLYIIFWIIISLLNSSCREPRKTEISWNSSGNAGIVAAGPKASVEAGLDMLAKGGNAVDAAVAAIFNLAVSDYESFCIGGEVPFMYYEAATGEVMVFNGMGGAPGDQKAMEELYSNGIPEDMTGIRLSTVPSALSTLLTALELKGTMSFGHVIAPTLKLLDSGEEDWYRNLAATFRKLADTERTTSGTREQKIKAARDRFYKGDIADILDDYYKSSGAYLKKEDLSRHTTTVEKPVTVSYRGYQVYKCNTWTQGPVLLQTLRLLENFDMKSMGFFSADYIHTSVEAMKLAYADRDKYYGDPQFVEVPLKQLLSDEYTLQRIKLIDKDKASHEIRPGDPYTLTAYAGPGQYWKGEHGTTTCAVTDIWGNSVAATPSANGDYGICEALGFAHNTRMTSFNTQNGHPNCLKPFKRPRITLTPTIVLKDGKPVIVMSVAGGDMQDQTSLQLILANIEFGMKPREALLAQRFYTYHSENSFRPSPDPKIRFYGIGALDIYDSDSALVEELVRRNHIIKEVPGPIGDPAMVYIDQTTGTFYAATEPFYERDSPRGKYCGALNMNEPKK